MRILLVAALITSAAPFVHASEYGCKVLLCLSNPAANGGPKGVAECIPPINQLFQDLRKGRPFPSCDIADGNDGSSYARVVFDPYDPCPPSLQPALPGSYVIQGQRLVDKGNPYENRLNFKLKGDPIISESLKIDGENTGPRACVGKPVGSYHVETFEDRYSVVIFDRVVWMVAKNPHAIDVFIKNALLQRVRW